MAHLQPLQRITALLLCAAAACGGGGSADAPAAAPSRSGDVWELDSIDDRARTKAALLAFVSGTHVLLVDGNDTYAGMRLTSGGKAPDGGQPLVLGGGIEATLAPSGDAMQLRFASGETLPMRKRVSGGSAR
ncbi:MAG: hypothetical protein ABI601_14745 [bacterium]